MKLRKQLRKTAVDHRLKLSRNNENKNNKGHGSIQYLPLPLLHTQSISSSGTTSPNLLSLSTHLNTAQIPITPNSFELNHTLQFTNVLPPSHRPSAPMASSAIKPLPINDEQKSDLTAPQIFNNEMLERAATSDEKFENIVHSLGIYFPKKTLEELANKGLAEKYEGLFLFSKNILNLKGCDGATIEHYVFLLKKFVIDNKLKPQKIVICSVPTSSNEPSLHGITKVASELATETGNIDGTKILTRIVNKKRFSAGMSERSIENASCGLNVGAAGVQGKAILLLDDICTSGCSMLAAKQELMNSGAARVVCLALGYTYNRDFIQNYTRSPLVEALLKCIKVDDKYTEYFSVIKESNDFLKAQAPIPQSLRPNSQVNAIGTTSSTQFPSTGRRLGSSFRRVTQVRVPQLTLSFKPPRSTQPQVTQPTLSFNPPRSTQSQVRQPTLGFNPPRSTQSQVRQPTLIFNTNKRKSDEEDRDATPDRAKFQKITQ